MFQALRAHCLSVESGEEPLNIPIATEHLRLASEFSSYSFEIFMLMHY